jgi:predicted nucleic acid-binding protein
MKERPNSGVLEWLSHANEDEVYVSVVTITELRYGVERLAAGKRRERLDSWLRKDLISRFEGRILPVDLQIADACGELLARRESMGRPIEARDAFIAATAEVHELTLVTRNTSDFELTLRTFVSPWS